MANYCCVTRTNYFRVKDEVAFRAFMERVYCGEDEIQLWEKRATDETLLFGFGCYGGISGVRNSQDEDDDNTDSAYDEFLGGLQSCIDENDAVIIMEVGNEKLRYLGGLVTIVTFNDIQTFDMTNWAVKKARVMLDNSGYCTECVY